MIHKLPAELLLFIFESILGREDHQRRALSYYRSRYSLSIVCTRWFSLVERSPQLWTTVAWGLKKERFKKVLERSSARLIDVEFDPAPKARRHQTLEDPFTAFLDILGPATRRLRTLNIAPRFGLEDPPSDFWKFPAPCLKRFIFTNSAVWKMENLELFDGNCPNLREIEVVGANCKWSQAAFKGLESLQLSQVSFNSVGDILDIIRDISQLKRLEICACEVQEEVLTDPEPVSPSHLQFLHVGFDEEYGSLGATEQLLEYISAPAQCSLSISLVDTVGEQDSLVVAFCDWLFGRQTRAVLEGVDGFKLGYNNSTGGLGGPADFELLSGSASIKGRIIGCTPEDMGYVLEYIRSLFQQSTATETFTTLSLSSEAVKLLDNNEIFIQLEEFPSITHLELVEPQRSSLDLRDKNVSGRSAGRTASLFSTVRNIVLRQVSPNDIMDILSFSMSKCRVKYLDLVEIHIKGEDFDKAEPVVEALRNNPSIGKVDVYVAL